MSSVQARIVFFCLLTIFASSAFAQPSLNHSCDATMEEAKNWLAKFNPTAPNAEQTFQEKKQRFDQWVDYCSKWATGWTVPFAFELPKKSATPQQINAGSTLHLREERPMFTSPATFENNTKLYVKVTCSSDPTRPATRTTDTIYPMVFVPSGDTITILKPADCSDSSGMYTQVRTQQGYVGYMQITRDMQEPATATSHPTQSVQPAPQQIAQTQSPPPTTKPTQNVQSAAPSKSAPQTTPPTQATASTPSFLSSISTATFYPLLALLSIGYIVCYLIFAKRIAGRIPTDGVGNSIIDAIRAVHVVEQAT